MGDQKNLQIVARALAGTMSQDTIKSATAQLKQMETAPGFSLSLLQLLKTQGVDQSIRQAAAIYFKNFIMMNWVPDEDAKDIIEAKDRGIIKEHILALMLTSPKLIQSQLSHALSIISKSDFPAKWEKLLPELISKLSSEDFGTLHGVLETANSIFFRYRIEMKSDALWSEIKYVLDNFAPPFLKLFELTCKRAASAAENKTEINNQFKILLLICEIFLSLSSQDIPAFFEESMDAWMSSFQNFLKYSNPHLAPSSSDESGPLDDVQASICGIVTLYTNKYEEQFQKWVPKFVNAVWELLAKLDASERYDQLVTKAVMFLTSVVKKEWHKNLFSKESDLKAICEKVVIPQLRLRESDVELFKINGLEYMRRDIEGSDRDTRRRTTVDFVRGLCVHFESQVTGILKGYVGTLLKEYASDPAKKWMAKDAAMYIILALSVKAKTQAKGATQINPYINIIEFFGTQVVPELQKDITDIPILKADCLKYVAEFRYQLPAKSYPVIFPLLYKFLASEEFVVHTYAAHAIERLLTVKDGTGPTATPRLTREALKPHLKNVFVNLFKALKMEESKENDYVMKALMRVCSVAQEDVAPVVQILMDTLTAILQQVSKNPKNPSFNHYVFETQACIIKYMCKNNTKLVENFEKLLFKPFQVLLTMETCQEFWPYVFQILSQMLEIRTDVSPAYSKIFPPLLTPTLWENRGNVPALTRLMIAYITKRAEVINPKLEGILGTFQKLNASKKHDQFGFALLSAIFESLPLKALEKYFPEIIKLLLKRAQTSPTPKFNSGLVGVLSLFISKHSVEPLLQTMESIQKGLFGTVLEKIWIPNIPSVTGNIPKKTVTVGTAKMLASAPILSDYIRFWPQLLGAVITMLEHKGDSSDSDLKSSVPGKEEAKLNGPVEEEDVLDSTKTLASAYAKLHFASPAEHDAHPDVSNVKEYLVKSLQDLTQRYPGKLSGALGSLPPAPKTALQSYCSQAGVRLG